MLHLSWCTLWLYNYKFLVGSLLCAVWSNIHRMQDEESVCQEWICVSSLILYTEREKERRREYTQSAGIYPYWSRNTYREGEGIEREDETRQTQEKEKETGLDLSVKTLTVVSCCSNPPAGFPFKTDKISFSFLLLLLLLLLLLHSLLSVSTNDSRDLIPLLCLRRGVFDGYIIQCIEWKGMYNRERVGAPDDGIPRLLLLREWTTRLDDGEEKKTGAPKNTVPLLL
jgi:hypothetical protein